MFDLPAIFQLFESPGTALSIGGPAALGLPAHPAANCQWSNMAGEAVGEADRGSEPF